MELKRLRQGQKVKIADPVRICARFWSNELGGVVGAGNQIVPREMLDKDAWVFRLADGYKGQRGLIVFGDPESNCAMWLGIESLERR